MKIILIGQAAFAQQVLDGLVARKHEIAAVYCPIDSAGARIDPVKARALELGMPVRQHKSLRGPAIQAEVAAFDADLAVLAFVTQIVPPGVFELPRFGSICFHPSLLPRYRGGSAVNWQIIRGERATGVSVFWVDAGIDTGPILLQRRATISPDDTAATLYYDTLFPLGVDAVIQAVELIEQGQAPRMHQDESMASYDPLCRDEHARIDWTRPIAEIYDLVRGCDPQPGAYTPFRGRKLRLYGCKRVGGGTNRPGLVESIADGSLVVGGTDGALTVGKVRLEEGKISVGEFVERERVVAGQTVLGI